LFSGLQNIIREDNNESMENEVVEDHEIHSRHYSRLLKCCHCGTYILTNDQIKIHLKNCTKRQNKLANLASKN